MHFILHWNLQYFSTPCDTLLVIPELWLLIFYFGSYSLENKSRKSCDKFFSKLKSHSLIEFLY